MAFNQTQLIDNLQSMNLTDFNAVGHIVQGQLLLTILIVAAFPLLIILLFAMFSGLDMGIKFWSLFFVVLVLEALLLVFTIVTPTIPFITAGLFS